MKRLWMALLAGLLLAALGCGPSDKDRNVNSGKDQPRTTTEKVQ
jgi:hypothetical protein